MSDGRLDGLRAAVELSPDNHALRLVLAEALRTAGHGSEALDQFAALLDVGALPDEELVGVGTLALDHERLPLAARCLEAARAAGVASGTEPLRERLQHALGESGALRGAVEPDGDHEEESAAGSRAWSTPSSVSPSPTSAGWTRSRRRSTSRSSCPSSAPTSTSATGGGPAAVFCSSVRRVAGRRCWRGPPRGSAGCRSSTSAWRT